MNKTAKALTLIFAGAIVVGMPFGLDKLQSNSEKSERVSVFNKAEAYQNVTQDLFNRHAIARDTFDKREANWMVCFDANEKYSATGFG